MVGFAVLALPTLLPPGILASARLPASTASPLVVRSLLGPQTNYAETWHVFPSTVFNALLGRREALRWSPH